MEHFYQDIQGWFEEDGTLLYKEVVAQAPAIRPSVFVEVGSWKGRSAAFMAVEIVNSGKPITLYCVDHWKPEGDSTVPYFAADPDTARAYEIFQQNLGQFNFVAPIQMDSIDATRIFSNHSVDFIYIDACHEYDAVRRDIDAWLPKVREDGTFAGDDLSWPGVWKAVFETFGFGNVRRIGKVWVRK